MAEHLLTPNDFIAGIAKEMEKQKLRMEQPPTPYQLEQEVRMKADLEKYELEQEFIYKGVRCYMKRPHGTFWCGYLDCGIVARVFDRLKGIAHGGMTTHN